MKTIAKICWRSGNDPQKSAKDPTLSSVFEHFPGFPLDGIWDLSSFIDADFFCWTGFPKFAKSILTFPVFPLAHVVPTDRFAFWLAVDEAVDVIGCIWLAVVVGVGDIAPRRSKPAPKNELRTTHMVIHRYLVVELMSVVSVLTLKKINQLLVGLGLVRVGKLELNWNQRMHQKLLELSNGYFSFCLFCGATLWW